MASEPPLVGLGPRVPAPVRGRPLSTLRDALSVTCAYLSGVMVWPRGTGSAGLRHSYFASDTAADLA